jgi:endopeptidase La
MFPMEFDHTLLDGLPLPTEEDTGRVIHIVRAVIGRRVMPYFRKSRGTDPITISRISEHLEITRLEDEENRVRCVDLVMRKDPDWTISIHERVFDYLAFVIPSSLETRLREGTPEEHKVLAFTEFLLRHEIEHMLYPQRTEREILQSDIAFSMEKRSEDPTYYRILRNVLSDEMNGLRGRSLLALLERADQQQPIDPLVGELLNAYAFVLGDIPEHLIQKVFPNLDAELKTKVLGVCYRRSRDASSSLLKRTSFLQKLLGLFELLMAGAEETALDVFNAFKDNWGLISLLQELGLPENSIENRTMPEAFQLFRDTLTKFSEQNRGLFSAIPLPPKAPHVESTPAPPAVKTLKDRIEEARNDPSFPARVLEVIDKNKLNAVGHSGAKFSELIETLLAIPWGKIQKIPVTPEEFERGIDSTHYGLRKPKEVICDFFTNLIWRYRQFDEAGVRSWRRNGSAFLFVGPPGVGKTSLAISIARNLKIPYHKLSLGGMRDEADLRGHGFTYEGSKPGAIVQGIVKMGVMNGMFIMDEADKTEKFAIATLLEILDPEQNHLFHDKYTETTVDIDLSNCHFVLTANTLETVPPAVINRCEVVFLDRYSVEEKVAIAREHLIQRVRERYQIEQDKIFFDPKQEHELLRYLVKTYTYEAGVRELERIVRTLFLRIFRKEILTGLVPRVRVTREKIKHYIQPPTGPRQINRDDRVGEMMALGVNAERGVGALIPIQATPIRAGDGGDGRPGYLSMVHATGNIQRIMDESRIVATTAIFHCASSLGIDLTKASGTIHLHFMGGSTPKDGPSAGGAIALALASVLSQRYVRRDVAMTGEIDTQGRITSIGALALKLESACDAGCKTVIIPRENLEGEEGVERLSDALKHELQTLTYETWKNRRSAFDHERHVLQIIAVDDILQAADIAFIDQEELKRLETALVPHALSVAEMPAKFRESPPLQLTVLYLKDIKELEPETAEECFWESRECILLASPEVRATIVTKFPRMGTHACVRDFDPARQDLGPVLEEVIRSMPESLATPARVCMVAPFFFLVRQRATLEEYSRNPAVKGLTLFANNYVAQGFKLKGCKTLLNRVYNQLARLDPQQLDDCPFLAKQEGIHVVDLSFIPEKYQLDTQRAAKILKGALTKWLTTIEQFPGRGISGH